MGYPGLRHEWEVRRQRVWVEITLKRFVSERKSHGNGIYLFSAYSHSSSPLVRLQVTELCIFLQRCLPV